MSTLSLDSPIPKDSWTLYWHSSEGRDWSLPSFVSFGKMATWREFHSIIQSVTYESISDGMFFLMRGNTVPRWENGQNIYGGAYSIRVPKENAGQTFEHYAVAAMLSEAVADPVNVINGLSISPKNSSTAKQRFNIIKIWNTNSEKFKKSEDLLCLTPDVRTSEILYTPFTDKKM